LPQPGPNSIKVGKIAETDVDAYFDLAQLPMHGICAGATGAGKTVAAMIIAEEVLKRNIPVIVFDPTAQWTGFMKPCRDKDMLALYPKFGLKPEDARRFPVDIKLITDPEAKIDIKKCVQPGLMTIFLIHRLKPEELDRFVRRTIDAIFAVPWPESKKLELLIVYDEVHRLLPKYGGAKGYLALERGCREFRKWGIGLWMVSQVLGDFKGAIRANIATEVQLRTRYSGDMKWAREKYGKQYAETLPKLVTGTAMVQNPKFNDGKPYFVTFRPLLHDPHRLSEEEIDKYVKFSQEIEKIEEKISRLKARGIDTTDIELELTLAKDKLRAGMIAMAETYLESVKARVERM
jgi:hypothetical protein